MSLTSTSAYNGVKVYNCTSGRTVPQWFEDYSKNKVKSLRYDQDYRGRLELIQDFDFPEASTRIKMSKNGQFIGVTGIYKPQIKIFSVAQLAMKFERHLDAEAVQFQFLADDYSKILILRADRVLEVHAAYGRHHTVRLPKFGRDMCYDAGSCDAYCVGSSNEAYRFNLDEGRFLSPIVTDLPSINVVGINPVHQLLGFGGSDGNLEFFDPRDRLPVGKLNLIQTVGQTSKALAAKLLAKNVEVTALRFDSDGLGVAIGTSSGHVLLYDLRVSSPVLSKDHRNGVPIVDLKYHPTSAKHVVSSDTKGVKIWDKVTGNAFTAVEPSAPINDVCLDSGLVMIAGEQHRIQAYYIPELGPAPKWASFLDNLTEELEEQKETPLHDDYKFVSREDLESWGLSHLIGTNLLKAVMHGFYMDLRLYNRVKTVTDPYVYEKYLTEQVKSKIEKKHANRIVVANRLPTVNKSLAALLLKQPEKQKLLADQGDATKADALFKNPLADDRFGDLFKKEDFQIDTNSDDFKRLNPNANSRFRTQEAELAANEDRSSDDENDAEESASEEDEDAMDNGESSDDDFIHSKKGKKPKKGLLMTKVKPTRMEADGTIGAKRSHHEMYELSGTDLNVTQDVVTAERANKKLTLEERIRELAKTPAPTSSADGGFKGGEFSFTPSEPIKAPKKPRDRGILPDDSGAGQRSGKKHSGKGKGGGAKKKSSKKGPKKGSSKGPKKGGKGKR